MCVCVCVSEREREWVFSLQGNLVSLISRSIVQNVARKKGGGGGGGGAD